MKQIELKSIYGKQKGAVHLCPLRDSITGALKGVRVLSPEEQRNSVRVVDQNTTRKVVDGLVLNLDNEVDRIDWQWMKECEEIAEDLESGLTSRNAVFYIYTPDKELDNKIKSIDLKFEALRIVKDASDAQRKEMARVIFGQNVDSFRAKEVYEYLADKAQTQPEKIVDGQKDPNYKTKLFLYQLVDRKILKVDGNGTYRYGEIIVGLNLAGAIYWLNDSKNRDLVGKFYVELYGGSHATLPSVIDELDSLHKSDKDSAGKPVKAGEAANIDLDEESETL